MLRLLLATSFSKHLAHFLWLIVAGPELVQGPSLCWPHGLGLLSKTHGEAGLWALAGKMAGKTAEVDRFSRFLVLFQWTIDTKPTLFALKILQVYFRLFVFFSGYFFRPSLQGGDPSCIRWFVPQYIGRFRYTCHQSNSYWSYVYPLN